MPGDSCQKSAFVLGAGFIGMNVIEELLNANYQVTVLVRRQPHADRLEAIGVSPLMGTLEDSDAITKQSKKSDVIIHTATADHVPSALAILEGAGVLYDGTAGRFKADKIYKDDSRDDMDSVPDSNPHRNVDIAIVSRQKGIGSGAKVAIMVPPLIYGRDEKYERLSIQMPTLTRFAVKRGFAGYIGDGKSVWSTVHVKDRARGYIALVHHMESAPAHEFLDNPYVFCENTGDNEPSWRDIASVIGRGLHAAGKISSPEPQTIPEEAYVDCAGPRSSGLLGMNSRSRAIRLQSWEWQPQEKAWDQSLLEDEIPAILEKKETFDKAETFNHLK
ncbi:hypothetical protein Q7P37_004615 [Cladosporium fusiforme]